MIIWLLTIAIVGLIVGAIARLLVPGRDPIGLFGTMLLGIVGAFVAAFLARALFHDPSVGWIGSIIGAVLCLLAYRAVSGRRHRVF